MKTKILLVIILAMATSMAFAKAGFVNARKALESVKEGKKVLTKLESELKKRETKIWLSRPLSSAKRSWPKIQPTTNLTY